jgi:hypothetical protein
MKSNFPRRVASLARSLWRRPAARAAARPRSRPALEGLEGRSLLSAATFQPSPPAPPFDHLYAFGESMSDDGNFFNVTGQPVAPYAGASRPLPAGAEQRLRPRAFGANKPLATSYHGSVS